MDAPEKIWCKPNSESWGLYGHWYRDSAGGGTEYTRTDRANELVAAAYEAAALEASEWSLAARSYIRDLTPADAVAALSARDARIREAALREAVECAKTRQRMLGQVSTEAALALLDALPDAIEALIAKDKANG